jgi:hypothetical protein
VPIFSKRPAISQSTQSDIARMRMTSAIATAMVVAAYQP